ncbi:HNH endonuclease [Klosneuvirus KNV1]|uniref:HNH endonuclease n=1 Tax=Klosneuvirus KNV1 TaxID=1977640 RepID=A0A1V0SKX6_9VIRU|nr:HNH endonuclease [Klosneuvirus KNV1]
MEIKLGGLKGGIAIVDADDYEELSKYKWYLNGYIKTTTKGKHWQMHRFIMKVTDSNQKVDHKNHNIFDNRKSNLRILTAAKNSANRKKKAIASSKYRGVCYVNRTKKYHVGITINNKRHCLGYYDNEDDAGMAYDRFMVHNKIDYIELNFPDKREEYLTETYVSPLKQKFSQYRGVHKFQNKYRATIQVNKKFVHISFSELEEECAKKYDEYIVKNNIPGRKLNFPDEHPDYNPNSKIKTLCKNIDENTVSLLINNYNTKIIKIDKNDYDKIKYYNCRVDKKLGYARITVNSKSYLLHRFLMNINDPNILIDHIDHDRLNNTRKNLRCVDYHKNAQNTKKRKGTTSQYIGVMFNKKKQKWDGRLKKNGKNIFNYRSDNEEHVARKRDLFIIENLKDDNYTLNFKWTDEDIVKWKTYLESK